MISLMVTAWGRVAGGLRPAMLTATTLNSIFSPTGRSFTLYWVLSTRSWFACTHSSPEEQEPVKGREGSQDGRPKRPGVGAGLALNRGARPAHASRAHLQGFIFTSSFAVLERVSVDSARAHFLRRTPLERTGGVGHILHCQANGLAGGGWEGGDRS